MDTLPAAGMAVGQWARCLFLRRALPAAAAGSMGDLVAGEPSVSRSLDNGLLSRADESSLRAGGDRERRSNLETFRGSGSFWSKRDRLAVRRSVSSMSSGL